MNAFEIPEVNLSDIDELWVVGSKTDDGFLSEENLKIDIKKELLEATTDNN